jgi:hypothetical protein
MLLGSAVTGSAGFASDSAREDPICLSFDDAEKQGWHFQHIRRGESFKHHMIENAKQLWDAIDRAERLVIRQKQSYYLMSPPTSYHHSATSWYGLSPSLPPALSFLLETRTCRDLCLGYAVLPQPSTVVLQPFLYKRHFVVDPSERILSPTRLDLSPYSFVFFSGDWSLDRARDTLSDEELKLLNRTNDVISFRDVWLLRDPQGPLSTDRGNPYHLENARYLYSSFVGGVDNEARYRIIARCLNGGGD